METSHYENNAYSRQTTTLELNLGNAKITGVLGYEKKADCACFRYTYEG